MCTLVAGEPVTLNLTAVATHAAIGLRWDATGEVTATLTVAAGAAGDTDTHTTELAVTCRERVEIVGLDDTAESGAGTVTVADTFTVSPATAACTAAPIGTVTAPPGATAARRVLSALLVPPGTARITVTCTSGGYADRAETVTFAAVAAGRCDDPLGTLANGRTVRSGTIAAGDGCTSLRRHPSPSRTYHARRHTFALHSPAQVTVTMESAASNASRLDTYLLLLDGDADDGSGRRLFYNDDIGPGHGTHRHNSRLTDMSLQPGTYTIEATAYGHYESYGNRATGDYDLTVRVGADPRSGCTHDLGLLGADRYRHDGTITADAACASGHLGSDTSRHYAHWHTFTLDTPAWIDLDALAPTASSIDPHVTLTGTDAGVLAQDDNTGTGNAAQTRGTYLPAGDYLVEIATADPDTAGDYTLTVTVPISGLAQTYEATVDQQTTINFNYWPTNALTDVVADSQGTRDVLLLDYAPSAGAASLTLAAPLVESHLLDLAYAVAGSGGSGGAARAATRGARVAVSGSDIREFRFTVRANCGTGEMTSPYSGVLCVSSVTGQTPPAVEASRGSRYAVTRGTLVGAKRAAQEALDDYVENDGGGVRGGVGETVGGDAAGDPVRGDPRGPAAYRCTVPDGAASQGSYRGQAR